jgi:hypothetical protein
MIVQYVVKMEINVKNVQHKIENWVKIKQNVYAKNTNMMVRIKSVNYVINIKNV